MVHFFQKITAPSNPEHLMYGVILVLFIDAEAILRCTQH